MALPDYIIVGAMKCGTSTLAAQLGAQKGLFMTDPKEPNFFSDDPVHAKGIDWYERLFDAAEPGDLKGEASTHYTKYPTYPEALDRLARVITQPKLIYMIRNPLARAVSHYMHEWSQGVISTDIEQALHSHPEIEAYGCYAAQITPWVERFGTDNVLVLSMENMQRNPQGILDQTGDFLGRPGLVWQDDLGPVNVSAERTRRFPLHGLLVGNPVATALRRTLVPQSLRDRIKASRQMQTRPVLSPAQTARLTEVYTADYTRLKTLFPDRPDLDLSYGFLHHG
ncbi:sulfotransferase (plasmid) [Roseobacter denitrificans]|uniref:Sulfotransferase, putative n=1 Tax=Roseobacter denitrificans (strain ATCC 33942 / OCh 114) TaxID=375451 RepID=Q07GI0_ROSDO|nr:sulfotransferase domain-containing protein [Roseobacter denitrificans]ABI93419.1 sulfotransferase, putative [Roseobacter denitrificans OCh 114]AVL55105.1 sulfotransferase [Roseobacter denitrificans]SFG44017.1 Sulfotransferase domain-containing protein [Roseobacter denitrificans OCh 114]